MVKCGECKHYNRLIGPDEHGGPTDECLAEDRFIGDSYHSPPVNIHGRPSEKNKNQNCKDFEKPSGIFGLIKRYKNQRG